MQNISLMYYAKIRLNNLHDFAKFIGYIIKVQACWINNCKAWLLTIDYLIMAWSLVGI